MISATEAARITEDNSFDTEDERLFAIVFVFHGNEQIQSFQNLEILI